MSRHGRLLRQSLRLLHDAESLRTRPGGRPHERPTRPEVREGLPADTEVRHRPRRRGDR